MTGFPNGDIEEGPVPSTGVDTYDCPKPGCDFNVSAAGPVDPDEGDPYAEDIEQHRRGHALAAENTLRVRALCDAERVLHKPTGRIGRVLGIYGDYATATRAWVAYGDQMNVTAHFDVPGREDSLIADLEPVDSAGLADDTPAPEHAPYLPQDIPGYEWVIDAEGEPIDAREVLEDDEPELDREALADTFGAAAQHLADGEPGCDCPLHMAVAARAVATDRKLRTVTLPPADERALVETVARSASSQAGLQSLVRPTPLDNPRAALAALQAIGDAGIAWQDGDPDQPAGIAAEAALSDAITTWRKAAGR